MDTPLRFQKWDGDEWPEKRISIADYKDHAIFVNARYLPIDVAETYAEEIVRAVNNHASLVEALEGILEHFAEIAGDCCDPDQAEAEEMACNKAIKALADAKGE